MCTISNHFLIRLTSNPGCAFVLECYVDTLTLSKEQKSLTEERIKGAGLEGRIRVHLLDCRDSSLIRKGVRPFCQYRNA